MNCKLNVTESYIRTVWNCSFKTSVPVCEMLFYLSALVEYKSLSGKTLQESIEREMSGRLEEILVAIGDYKGFL